MCGIAGLVHFEDLRRPIDAAALAAMTRSLRHRGPDAEGVWHAPGVGLGHRRLAILDLSDAGRQPMHDPTGRYTIVFNGEIYNFRELRAALEARGRAFRSTGDTEVVLAAFAEFGVEVVEHLSGIYAFALWDATEQTLFLARDALGVKPLFYGVHGGTLRFGSEIKAILADSESPREPDEAALDAFFTFGYTPAPATGFRGIRQLPPGCAARVSCGGVRTWRYWRSPYEPEPRELRFEQAVEEFGALLDRVTRAQLVSDVPVGAFLSGGLDSAAIVRSMVRARLGEVHALTVGFDETAFDERDPARRTARALGVALAEQVADLDVVKLLPTLARHVEEPTADSSILPVYLLCRAARERFTVAMSGDGADEILAGYDTYRATALAARYRALPRWLRRGVLAPLARRLPVSDAKYSLNQVANRFIEGAELGPGRDHAAWRRMLSAESKERLYARGMRAACGADPLDAYADCIGAVPSTREPLAGLLNADTEFYLPNDMLVKVDRMSMAHGLEVRVPFLDVEMVRFAANLPGEFKLHRGRRRKHILRESLRGSIPDAVLDRKKSGFNVPLERWMRGPLRSLLLDAVATRRDALSRYVRPAEIEQLAAEHAERRADHAHALFTLLMFALWLDNARRPDASAGDERLVERRAAAGVAGM
ncbi:MAG: asparagine synthase (glutamine-hydrolyzing) [Phycisphaerae bacterium]